MSPAARSQNGAGKVIGCGLPFHAVSTAIFLIALFFLLLVFPVHASGCASEHCRVGRVIRFFAKAFNRAWVAGPSGCAAHGCLRKQWM